jgi:excisionase family DNA binding protein
MVDLAAPTPAAEQEPADEHGPLIDVGGSAERLGVDVRFVRRLVDERRIPFYKVGKHVRFDPADVAHWLAERRVATSGARRLVLDDHSR